MPGLPNETEMIQGLATQRSRIANGGSPNGGATSGGGASGGASNGAGRPGDTASQHAHGSLTEEGAALHHYRSAVVT